MSSIWSDSRRSPASGSKDHRSPFEHDYDRLLFSTPVRRLADKTQVFPLDRSDAVRTRLTHSHEVANLARSMGNRLIHHGFSFPGISDTKDVPTILATIGLAHDLGNPPFGHQGEAAIGNWFKLHPDVFIDNEHHDQSVPDHLKNEFLKFEGNAQAFRILTHLQVALGGFGLDLTAATLSALMKYPVTCDKTSDSSVCTKKYGFFESEFKTVQWVRSETGVGEGQRHPLTWIMEAADDIAYSVLDIEDAMHKGIISPDDVREILGHELGSKYKDINSYLNRKFKEVRRKDLSIREAREVMCAYLRTKLIECLICEAIDDYKADHSDIFSFKRQKPLMHDSRLLKTLKNTARDYVFTDSDVRKIEADGFKIVAGLMDFYWYSIHNRKERDNLTSRRQDAKSAYGQSKISDNYLNIVNRSKYIGRNNRKLPVRYKELRLLTDMVSGMSDGFAKHEYEYLKANEILPICPM